MKAMSRITQDIQMNEDEEEWLKDKRVEPWMVVHKPIRLWKGRKGGANSGVGGEYRGSKNVRTCFKILGEISNDFANPNKNR